MELACRGLTLVTSDCASWILRGKAYRPLNVFEASTGLFPLLTDQDPPSEEALNWLVFAYSIDRVGDFVVPASTVLDQSTVLEGGTLLSALLEHLRRLCPKL